MFYATEQYISASASLHHSIFSFGNPVVWWGALAALAVVLFRFLRSRHYIIDGEEQRWHLSGLTYDIRYGFVFIGLLAQYLPWVPVPRGTYIYHYFASIPFLILATSLCLDFEDRRFRRTVYIIGGIYLLAAFAFFIILLPYAAGMAAPFWWLDIGKTILRIWY